MLYFANSKELPLYNFFEIIENNDVGFLLKKPKELTKDEILQLKAVWVNIFDEYITLRNNEQSKEHYRVRADVLTLEAKLQNLKTLTYLFSVVSDNDTMMELIKALSSLGFPIDQRKPRQKEYERLIRHQKAIQTNINRKKSDRKDIFNKEKKQVKRNYEQDVADVEMMLNKNFIDTKKVTVSRWVSYLNQVDKKIKDGRKSRVN